MTSRFRTLSVTRDGALLRVELHVPARGNPVSEAVMDDLLAVLAGLRPGADHGVRVLILSGAGDHFCGGGDLTELRTLARSDPSGDAVIRLGRKFGRLLDRLQESDPVTIARIHGRWLGAGMALAAACHLRVASASSTAALPETALGLPLAWGSGLQLLAAEAGRSAIRHLLLTRQQISADTALRLGLVHRVAPDEDLDHTVEALAATVLRGDRFAATLSLSLLDQPPGGQADAALMALALLRGQ